MPNFKCLYCDRYFSSRQAYAQHVNKTHNDINDTSLDDKDSNRIEELQIVREESLPSITNEYEDQNMSPASYENIENTDALKSNVEDYDNFEQVSPERL
ncbi:8857_t:CDS:2 [Dentiscutata erythropus]|uniref:8857_t:CDS:1 n=1 Tax=Dentiscutata erythropus TaxID=1348616 RepID=A0A9N9NX91_9GLOM|nr:8857_t:CDS:2 [Dentiscutata erythropus]